MVAVANRVDRSIAFAEAKLSGASLHKKDLIGKVFSIDAEELCVFQQMKTAVSGTLLSLEESTQVYRILGNSPSVFNGQSVAVKVAVLNLMRLIMEKMLRV